MKVFRVLVQIVTAIIGWMVFGWLWWQAIVLGPSDIQLRGTVLVAIIDLVVVMVTALWILWNKDIYRRKGPRRSVPVVGFAYEQDALGTPVEIRGVTGGADRSIVVDIHDEDSGRVKVFRAVERPRAEGGSD
ncbi:MAG: hypothetical protein JXP37_10370 [Coriobacteriia bacterium]|nr:hypothetical protein [Coriobacteriia bacterium]